MGLFDLLLLAVVQGVTEFLPVSSSGHLVLLGVLLGGESVSGADLADSSLALHVGTLVAIVVFYRSELWRMCRTDRRQLGTLLVGSLPVATIGVPLKLTGWDESLHDPRLAATLLVVTGVVLLLGRHRGDKQPGGRLTYRMALWIGMVQAVAILPGLSRSGLTITAGLVAGLSSREAARFSFLLAMPAIGGAGLLQVIELVGQGGGQLEVPVWQLGVATLVAATVGWLSLTVLVAVLERGRLAWFSVWCVPCGLGMLAYTLATL